MYKKVSKIILILSVVLSIVGFSNPASAQEMPRPSYVSLNLIEEQAGVYNKFELSWKNGDMIQSKMNEGQKIEYEVDFRKNNQAWLSESTTKLITGVMNASTIQNSKISITQNELPQIGQVDIFQSNYSFRIRYSINGEKGPFSNSVRVGMRPGFENASEWSEIELKDASKNGFISPSIQKNMKSQMTREEFADILIRVYEKVKKIHLVTAKSPFTDSDNPSVIKAAKLGIVQGVGWSKFNPQANVTRQEMATMLTRFLKSLNQSLNKPEISAQFLDHADINDWALESIYQLQGFGLIEGDQNNNFLPKNNATREEGVALGQRVYDLINK